MGTVREEREMSRYIDADALKANCDIVVGDTTIGRRDYVMFHEIDSAPSIDIVRCKECKWLTKDQYDEPYCGFHSIGIYADDYCSYGEREGE